MAAINQDGFSLVLDEQDYNALMKKLEYLSDVDREAVINSALKEGTTLLTESGKQQLIATILHPETSKGRLYRSMGIKVLKATKKKGAAGYSGFKRTTKKEYGGGNAAHLVDRGTVERWNRTQGHSTGRVKGSLFWTTTVQQQGPRAMDMLLKAIGEALDKLWNKK